MSAWPRSAHTWRTPNGRDTAARATLRLGLVDQFHSLRRHRSLWGGAASSLNDPKPAIFAAIGLTGVLWIGWRIFRKRAKRNAL